MSNTNWLKVRNSTNIYLDNTFRGIRILSQTGVNSLADIILKPDVLQSFFSKPEDWLSRLLYFPYPIPQRLEKQTKKLQIGTYSTNIDVYDIDYASEIYEMGELLIEPHFNNFADYDGYSKIEVWLPFLGTVDISLNDVLGKYLKFRLGVDYTSGQGTWYICVGDNPTNATSIFVDLSGVDDRILSTHTCQIGMEIPIGTTNTASVYRNLIMGAVKGVSTALSSYAVSKLGATGGTTTTKEVKTRRNKKTGRQYKFSTRTVESVFDASNYQYGNAIVGAFDCATDSLNNMHISASTDRSNNPTTMINTCKSIKVIRYYPKLITTDENYGKLYGYPLGQTKVLSTLSGYTEISNIHLEGEGFKSATQKEILMLKEALSDGIIL